MNEAASHLLDGITMQYTYAEMGTVRTVYDNGFISFEWLSGPLQGETGVGFVYRAREVGENRCFVNWHEPELPGFVTLYVDFEMGQVYSSLIASYASTKEQVYFDIALIENVEHT